MHEILNKKGFICDMDGVIYHGNEILDGVKDFVNWLYNDEAGKTAYSSAFGGVPFNFEYIMTGEAQEITPSSEAESEISSESSASSAAKEIMPEENPEMVGPMNPSHKISGTLMESVAEYYAEGNWIPDLSFALPADYSEKILGENLSDYWGMETWADSDRKDFKDILLGGWKERLDKENAAVG